MSLRFRAPIGAIVLFAIIALLVFTFMAGCSDWERQTTQALSASQRVINEAAADYNAGAIEKSQANYHRLEVAKDLQKNAADSFASYLRVKASIQSQLQAKQISKADAESQIAALRSGVDQAAAEVSKILPEIQALIQSVRSRPAASQKSSELLPVRRGTSTRHMAVAA